MIINKLVSTGEGTSGTPMTATIIGVPNEVIDIYGPTTTRVTLPSSGQTTLTLVSGDYQIIGSISKGSLPAGRYFTLSSSSPTLKTYPDNIIFWYGVLGNYGSYSATYSVNGSTSTGSEIRQNLSVNGSQGTTKYAKGYFATKVNLSNYSKILGSAGGIIRNANNQDSYQPTCTCKVGYSNNTTATSEYTGYTMELFGSYPGNTNLHTINVGNNTLFSVDVSGVTGEQYVGMWTKIVHTSATGSSSQYMSAVLKALWLE